MKLRILLPSLLCTFAVHLSAADLERIVPAPERYRLAITQYPAAKPSARRSIRVCLHSVGRDAKQLAINTYWIGGTPRGVLGMVETFYTTSPDSYMETDRDSLPQSQRIEGWVVTVRDKATGALLAVKGSTPAMETLARTPGALTAK